MDVLKPGEHGSTFGGNPLACAIARAALKILVEENLIENAENMGRYFMEQLEKINSPYVKEIRGRGLMIGIELHSEVKGARKLCEKLMKSGLLCKETHEHIIRIAPPLVIQKPDIDWAIDKIGAVLR